MSELVVRRLGRVEYEPTWRAMQDLTETRGADTPDEIWLCEHPPVYTLGQAGKPEHLLRDIGIPVVKIDRGGQITYHGLALNVDMDLAPYAAINPCGYEGMPVTQLRELCGIMDAQSVAARLTAHLQRQLQP
ncbi:Octanoyltransferase [Rhodocyclaceae bacterium]|nr:Octanoyltransferase [Rhodocyclaceae bacterium]